MADSAWNGPCFAGRGYRVTVLRDGCADGDPAVHDFFMDAVFPSRGFTVTPCADWHPEPA